MASSTEGPPTGNTSMPGSQVRSSCLPCPLSQQPPRVAQDLLYPWQNLSFFTTTRLRSHTFWKETGVPVRGASPPPHNSSTVRSAGRRKAAGRVRETGFPLFPRVNTSTCKGPEVGGSWTCVRGPPRSICRMEGEPLNRFIPQWLYVNLDNSTNSQRHHVGPREHVSRPRSHSSRF